MPAFEALLRAGRETATVLYTPQASVPSIPAALALPLPVPVCASLPAGNNFLHQESKHRESGKQAGMESLKNCLLMAAAPLHGCSRGFPSPRTVKQPIRALSFLQLSQLGCWLGFLKQSLASFLADFELVYLVWLVWRTTPIPISSCSAGRCRGALHAGAQHHSLQPDANGSPGFSPHPTH